MAREKEIVAKLNNLRTAPRKVRAIADAIRSLEALEAKRRLEFFPKRAAAPLLKLLNSAIANAKHNFKLEEKNLYIHTIFVDEGRKLKRWIPRAFGRMSPIQKKTSDITVILKSK